VSTKATKNRRSL